MKIVTAVTLANGYPLNPDKARDRSLLRAAGTAVEGGFIERRTVPILRQAHVEVYEVARRASELWVLQ